MGSEFNFQKLTPFDKIENLDFYEDALDFALNEKDIKNIAITGIYGAGKSSVLESYKNLKSQDKKWGLYPYFSCKL